MAETSKDSLWQEEDPGGAATPRTELFIAQDGSGNWGFETDRREADGFIKQNSSNQWGIDLDADSGGFVVAIGDTGGVIF